MNVFLIDADNLSAGAWLDEAFRILEDSEGPLPVRRAYGSAENLKGLSEALRAWAVRPFVNLSLTKNTTDIALAVDAMELACQTPAPKLVVIGSGDADFVPLVVRLRERGIRMVCVSERGKMGREAVSAYDRVILVGQEQALHEALVAGTEAPVGSRAPAKKAAAKSAEPSMRRSSAAKKGVEEAFPSKAALKKAADKAAGVKAPAKKAASKTSAAKPATKPAAKVKANRNSTAPITWSSTRCTWAMVALMSTLVMLGN